MIIKLTPEQEARLPLFRQEWFEIGSSCEPADRATAEKAISELYKTIDRKPPRFIWVRSPLEAQYVIHVLEHLKDDLKEVLDRSHPVFPSALLYALPLGVLPRESIRLRSELKAAIRDRLSHEEQQLRADMKDRISKQATSSTYNTIWQQVCWPLLQAEDLKATVQAGVGERLNLNIDLPFPTELAAMGSPIWTTLCDILWDSLGRVVDVVREETGIRIGPGALYTRPFFSKELVPIWITLCGFLSSSLGEITQAIQGELEGILGESLRYKMYTGPRHFENDVVYYTLFLQNIFPQPRSTTSIILNLLHDSLQDPLWRDVVDTRYTMRDVIHNEVSDKIFEATMDVFISPQSKLANALIETMDFLWTTLQEIFSEHKVEYNDPWFYGSMDSYWIAFYNFCQEIGVEYDPEVEKKLALHTDIARSCSWWWAYENACIISDRPREIHWDEEQQRLHCNGGPAISFRDNWEIHALNGIRVSKEVAETPGEELDPHLILQEQNADVRREIVRKVGIERMLDALDAKVLDTQTFTALYPIYDPATLRDDNDPNWSELPLPTMIAMETREHTYELVNLDLGDGRSRPYLKMLNPSIGTWHVEGVPPHCTTVESALEFRNGTKEFPTILT